MFLVVSDDDRDGGKECPFHVCFERVCMMCDGDGLGWGLLASKGVFGSGRVVGCGAIWGPSPAALFIITGETTLTLYECPTRTVSLTHPLGRFPSFLLLFDINRRY